jgi:hypothetical protein
MTNIQINVIKINTNLIHTQLTGIYTLDSAGYIGRFR